MFSRGFWLVGAFGFLKYWRRKLLVIIIIFRKYVTISKERTWAPNLRSMTNEPPSAPRVCFANLLEIFNYLY